VRIPRSLFPALLLVLAPAGCVERKFMIRSDPEGIPVRVNGVVRGTTPLEIPFNDYGVVRLETEPVDGDGDGFPEYEGFSGPFHLRTPWYQWFPFDFFSDNLWPGTLQVRREACLVLSPALDPDSPEDTERMKAKIPSIRIRAERMRFEEEAAPPVEKR
jgi:hypothetical protein